MPIESYVSFLAKRTRAPAVKDQDTNGSRTRLTNRLTDCKTPLTDRTNVLTDRTNVLTDTSNVLTDSTNALTVTD